MKTKRFIGIDVLTAAKQRINFTFDNFERIFVSFSGGKDSTVMLHLVAEEAIKRKRTVGVMLIDFEAQYKCTSENADILFEKYKDNIELYWVCLSIALRNAVSNFEPSWTCWDPERAHDWVRELPKHKNVISDISFFPFFHPRMEFEEFIILFAEWYAQDQPTAAFIGIRAD